MKRNSIAMIALVGFATATVAMSATAAPQSARGQRGQQGQGECIFFPDGLDVTPLSDDEAAELRWMRQEEKLARDVYLALFNQWDYAVFRNISYAEQRHMDAMARLIVRYDLIDPVVDDTPGVFTNPVFANLYDQLVENGSVSLLDAFMVGALIEELDIVDLYEAIDLTTHPDLTWVYENLLRGSRNHLRTFAAQIDFVGGEYVAVHLTQDEFDAIANSPWERGNGRRGGQRRGQGQGQGQGMGNGLCPNPAACNRTGRGNRRGNGRGNGNGNGNGNGQGRGR